MILEHHWDADALGDRSVVLEDSVFIRHRLRLRRHHDAIRAKRLGHLAQCKGREGTAVAGANDHRHIAGGIHGRLYQLLTLSVEKAI